MGLEGFITNEKAFPINQVCLTVEGGQVGLRLGVSFSLLEVSHRTSFSIRFSFCLTFDHQWKTVRIRLLFSTFCIGLDWSKDLAVGFFNPCIVSLSSSESYFYEWLLSKKQFGSFPLWKYSGLFKSSTKGQLQVFFTFRVAVSCICQFVFCEINLLFCRFLTQKEWKLKSLCHWSCYEGYLWKVRLFFL